MDECIEPAIRPAEWEAFCEYAEATLRRAHAAAIGNRGAAARLRRETQAARARLSSAFMASARRR